MRKEERIYVQKPVDTIVEVTCDRCGKLLSNYGKFGYQSNPNLLKLGFKPVPYHEISTGHREWDGDSCYSVDELDACPECRDAIVKSIFDGSMIVDGSPIEVYPSTYVNIQSRTGYVKETEKENEP